MDHFYIDFNALVYQCIRVTYFFYYNSKAIVFYVIK